MPCIYEMIGTHFGLGHGNENFSSPSHDFEKWMRLFFIFHYSLFSFSLGYTHKIQGFCHPIS